MLITPSLADAVTRRIPPVISPETHGFADFLIAGTFLMAAAFFWRMNRRASLGAALCGGAGLGIAALTDYSGRSQKPIHWRTHQKIDLGLAAMTGAMPELLSFAKSRDRSLFTGGAVAMTALTNLTVFPRRYLGE